MKRYLQATEYIDWNNPEVTQMAQNLSSGLSSDEAITKQCFEFVRDQIKHSFDYQLNPVTVKASEVLNYKTGYCYAKSHLLAALLRANNIPAGLCYQRLTIENDKAPFCLHGLNAVFLKNFGWYRIDPRGNKKNVNAQFCPPKEQIAFQIAREGECNIQGIWPSPLPIVTDVLNENTSYDAVYNNLPDIEIISKLAL